METIVAREKRTADPAVCVTPCSANVFAKILRCKSSRIRIAKDGCTFDALWESLLRPKTTIGLIILMRCCNEQQINELKNNIALKQDCLRIIEKTIQFFPSYCINDDVCNVRNSWDVWCQITAPLVPALSYVHFSNKKAPKPTIRPYDKRLNLKNFKPSAD